MKAGFKEQKDTASGAFRSQNYPQALDACLAALKFTEGKNDKFIKMLLAQTLTHFSSAEFSPALRDAVLTTLQSDGIDYKKIMTVWYRMMMLDPAFVPLFKERGESLSEGEWKELEPILTHPYLTEGLRRFIIAILPLELILVRLRRILLLDILPKGGLKTKHLNFLCALAELCFTNEYIYDVTEAEKKAVAVLSKDDAIAISLRGCYEPLYKHQFNRKISAVQPFRQMVALQVTAKEREIALRNTIPALGAIKNAVSQNVQAMYEENPYPRWSYIDVPVHTAADTEGDILVAGCGTGQYVTYVALNFPHLHVEGVDISLSSLAYAKRQAEDYGAHNTNFRQCDILELPLLGKKFDYINCSGVLHHMADPEAGWRKLIEVMKPGGAMYISLYSTIAHRVLSDVRQQMRDKGLKPNFDDMKKARADIIGRPRGDKARAVAWYRDFYSASEMRDLIFHIQERTYTFLELKDIFERLDLELVQMISISDWLKKHYLEKYPDNPAMDNFEYWHAIEPEFPDAFAAMYHFICKRKSDSHLNPLVQTVLKRGV